MSKPATEPDIPAESSALADSPALRAAPVALAREAGRDEAALATATSPPQS